MCVCVDNNNNTNTYTDGQMQMTETGDVVVDSNGLYANNDYSVHRIVKPLLQTQQPSQVDDERRVQNDFTTFLRAHIDKALSDGFNDSVQHGKQSSKQQQNVASFDVPALKALLRLANRLHKYFMNDERIFDRVYPMANAELHFTSKYVRCYTTHYDVIAESVPVSCNPHIATTAKTCPNCIPP